MFKFSKIVVLFIIIVSLIGCNSSIPDNIRKHLWEESIQIVETLDTCYYDECDFEGVFYNQYHENYIPTTRYEDITEEEELLRIKVMDLLDAYTLLNQSMRRHDDFSTVISLASDYENKFNVIAEELYLEKRYEIGMKD